MSPPASRLDRFADFSRFLTSIGGCRRTDLSTARSLSSTSSASDGPGRPASAVWPSDRRNHLAGSHQGDFEQGEGLLRLVGDHVQAVTQLQFGAASKATQAIVLKSSNYPPAKPGALRCEPLKAAQKAAYAAYTRLNPNHAASGQISILSRDARASLPLAFPDP